MMWMVMLVAVTSCINDTEPEWSLSPGDELPEFSVTTLDGNVVTRSSFTGKKGYIIFFSTECGDCRRELPEFERMYRDLMMSDESSGVEFICISRSEDAASVDAYWRENSFTMPVAAVADRSVYDLFATIGIPRLYVTDGIIIAEVYSFG